MFKKKGVSLPLEKGAVPDEEKILRRIPGEILLLAFFISCASLIFFGEFTSFFIFAGGALSALSFFWLKASITRFLIPDRKKAIRTSIVFYSLRLLLILAIFFIIIIFFSKRIIAFMIGFSVIVPVFLVEGILGLAKIKKWKG
jgi:hypothetical protein